MLKWLQAPLLVLPILGCATPYTERVDFAEGQFTAINAPVSAGAPPQVLAPTQRPTFHPQPTTNARAGFARRWTFYQKENLYGAMARVAGEIGYELTTPALPVAFLFDRDVHVQGGMEEVARGLTAVFAKAPILPTVLQTTS